MAADCLKLETSVLPVRGMTRIILRGRSIYAVCGLDRDQKRGEVLPNGLRPARTANGNGWIAELGIACCAA
jgi:hypothetical protein